MICSHKIWTTSFFGISAPLRGELIVFFGSGKGRIFFFCKRVSIASLARLRWHSTDWPVRSVGNEGEAGTWKRKPVGLSTCVDVLKKQPSTPPPPPFLSEKEAQRKRRERKPETMQLRSNCGPSRRAETDRRRRVFRPIGSSNGRSGGRPISWQSAVGLSLRDELIKRRSAPRYRGGICPQWACASQRRGRREVIKCLFSATLQ